MFLREIAFEMFGELIVPTHGKTKEVDCDDFLLNKYFDFEEVMDYDLPYLEDGLDTMVILYQKMGGMGEADDSVDDASEFSGSGKPIVSETLYYYVEQLLLKHGDNSERIKSTLAKAIELVAFNYAFQEELDEEEHKRRLKRCKETVTFVNFIEIYLRSDEEGPHYTRVQENYNRPERDIEKISIHYGKGTKSGKVKFPNEWFEMLTTYFLSNFQKKSGMKLEKFLNEIKREAETFIRKYSKISVKRSEVQKRYANSLNDLLKEIGIEGPNQRYLIIGDIFFTLGLFDATSKVKYNQALFPQKSADKIQKLIIRKVN